MKQYTRISSLLLALLAVLSVMAMAGDATYHHAAIFGFASSIPHVVPWGGSSDHIRIRTKVKDFYSYIEAAVLRLGGSTIEVTGGSDGQGRLWVNGEERCSVSLSFEGVEADFRQLNSKQFQFTADLGNGDVVKFETFPDFIRVDIETNKNDQSSSFAEGFGMMGSFPEGVKIARDQSTITKSSRKFAKEWIVLDTEE